MDQFQEQLPAEGLARIEIELHQGNVTLRAARGGEAAAIRYNRGLQVEIRGGTLIAKQHRSHTGGADLILPSSVHWVRCRLGHGDIRLEGVEAEVDARTGSGDVRIGGARGRVEAQTGRGNLVAGELSGDVALLTGHGDIVATDLDGVRLKAHTGHGDIALAGRLVGLEARTGNGAILCRCDLDGGSHEMQSGHGNLEIHLPAGTEARIDAATRHGRIETNLPLVRVGTSGPWGNFNQRLVGSTGGGTARATALLKTGWGDVKVFRQEVATPVEPSPARPDSPRVLSAPTEAGELSGPREDPRMPILESVGRGEITVDEALLLLERVG